MLLSEQDRQGIDLVFTNNGTPLLSLDNTQLRVVISGNSAAETFQTQGISIIGNIKMSVNTVSTSLLNQPLLLQANGIANVTIVNANVISGSVNGTLIGSLDPRPATFTFLNSNALATLSTANIGNLHSNLIPFTAANGILSDNPTLRFFDSNNTMILANLTVLQNQTFTTIDTGNVIINNAIPGAIAFIAANNFVTTAGNLLYDRSNNVVTAGNVRLTTTNTSQVLFVNDSTKAVTGTNFLTFDGTNLRANGITRLSELTFFGNTISTAVNNADLILFPSGTGLISAADKIVRNLATPVQPSDAVTKAYVDAINATIQQATNTINQQDTRVRTLDDGLATANITFVVQNVEQARITSSLISLQDITINDSTISTQAGAMVLSPDNNEKLIVDTASAMRLPIGADGQRPTAGLEALGDFRFNTDINNIEWYDGNDWINPTNNAIASQVIVPDGILSTFTLGQLATTASVLVNFNGVIQRPSTTYTVAGDQLTFSTVPLITDIIEIRLLNSALAAASSPIVIDKTYANIGTTTTSIDSWYVNEYRSAVYTYTAKTQIGNNFEVGEVRVVHDGSATFSSNNFTSKTASSMISWSFTNNPVGVINLRAQGTHADVSVKYHVLYFTEDYA